VAKLHDREANNVAHKNYLMYVFGEIIHFSGFNNSHWLGGWLWTYLLRIFRIFV